MRHPSRVARSIVPLAVMVGLALGGAGISAQAPLRGVPGLSPPSGPMVLHTAEVPRIRVVPIAHGLSHPWGMAFRQNGDILITERDTGTLRVIRDGQLMDEGIPGVPEVVKGRRPRRAHGHRRASR